MVRRCVFRIAQVNGSDLIRMARYAARRYVRSGSQGWEDAVQEAALDLLRYPERPWRRTAENAARRALRRDWSYYRLHCSPGPLPAPGAVSDPDSRLDAEAMLATLRPIEARLLMAAGEGVEMRELERREGLARNSAAVLCCRARAKLRGRFET